MSAGTGIEHSEINASATEPVHFLQLWIEPSQAGAEPGFGGTRTEMASAHSWCCRAWVAPFWRRWTG